MTYPDCLFSESSAAAQSQKNFWTQLASTYKCIEVRLTEEQLIIKPQGIFGWMLKILYFDLDHSIPLNQIKHIKTRGKWLDYGKVEVEFIKNGNIRQILLYLKNHKAFEDAMKQRVS